MKIKKTKRNVRGKKKKKIKWRGEIREQEEDEKKVQSVWN